MTPNTVQMKKTCSAIKCKNKTVYYVTYKNTKDILKTYCENHLWLYIPRNYFELKKLL